MEREKELSTTAKTRDSSVIVRRFEKPLRLSPYYKDMWAPHREKYRDPTDAEYGLVCEYMRIYSSEKGDFVEDEEWKNAFKDIPNVRKLLIEHLHQIRESKGYDVDRYLYFFSPFIPISEFTNENLKERAIQAANFAVDKINANFAFDKVYDDTVESLKLLRLDKAANFTIDKVYADTVKSEKILKLVRLDKAVWVRQNECFLLTLTMENAANDVVKDDPLEETDANAPCLKTIRAMVFGYDKFKLKEWNPKK